MQILSCFPALTDMDACNIIKSAAERAVQPFGRSGGEMMKKRKLLDLFLTFMKIGLFTFGGGYAMLSIIEQNCVDKKAWITHDDMMNITVIAESTPGPIAINCATFVGFRQAGFPGAVIATLGIVFPSFVIIYAISRFFDHFLEIAIVMKAFQGIKIAVGLLIMDAAVTMIRKMRKNRLSAAILIVSFGAMLVINGLALRVSPIALMLLAAAVSFAVFLLRESQDGKDGGGGTK